MNVTLLSFDLGWWLGATSRAAEGGPQVEGLPVVFGDLSTLDGHARLGAAFGVPDGVFAGGDAGEHGGVAQPAPAVSGVDDVVAAMGGRVGAGADLDLSFR